MLLNLYDITYQSYADGYLSVEGWRAFCALVLEELMEEKEDILKRLAGRE